MGTLPSLGHMVIDAALLVWCLVRWSYGHPHEESAFYRFVNAKLGRFFAGFALDSRWDMFAKHDDRVAIISTEVRFRHPNGDRIVMKRSGPFELFRLEAKLSSKRTLRARGVGYLRFQALRHADLESGVIVELVKSSVPIRTVGRGLFARFVADPPQEQVLMAFELTTDE